MSDIVPTQICLSEEEQDAFRLLADELAGYDPVTETEQFVMTAQLLSSRLPERMSSAARRMHAATASSTLARNLNAERWAGIRAKGPLILRGDGPFGTDASLSISRVGPRRAFQEL